MRTSTSVAALCHGMARMLPYKDGWVIPYSGQPHGRPGEWRMVNKHWPNAEFPAFSVGPVVVTRDRDTVPGTMP